MPKCVRCHDYKAGREARGWWDRRDGVAEYLIYGSHYHITRREGVSYADGAWGWRENAIAVSARLRKATGVWLCAIRGCSLDAKLIDLAERMLEARRGHDCVLDKVAAVWDKIPDDRYLSAGWKTAVGISPYVSGAYPPTIWRCLRAHPSQYRYRQAQPAHPKDRRHGNIGVFRPARAHPLALDHRVVEDLIAPPSIYERTPPIPPDTATATFPLTPRAPARLRHPV